MGKYDFQVSKLPDDLRECFMRIQSEVFDNAKSDGWNPELDDND